MDTRSDARITMVKSGACDKAVVMESHAGAIGLDDHLPKKTAVKEYCSEHEQIAKVVEASVEHRSSEDAGKVITSDIMPMLKAA